MLGRQVLEQPEAKYSVPAGRLKGRTYFAMELRRKFGLEALALRSSALEPLPHLFWSWSIYI
jgi:hypothetical protein